MYWVLPWPYRSLAAFSVAVRAPAYWVLERADVAAVKVRQIYTSSDGQPNEAEGEGTPMFVMAKEDGRWCLVACQNTPVLDT